MAFLNDLGKKLQDYFNQGVNSVQQLPNTIHQDLGLLNQQIQPIIHNSQNAMQIPQMVNNQLTQATRQVYGNNPFTSTLNNYIIPGISNAAGALTAPFTNQSPMQKAGNVLKGVGSVAMPGQAIAGGLFNSGVNIINNLYHGNPINQNFAQANRQGYAFGAQLGPIAKLVGIGANPLLNKVGVSAENLAGKSALLSKGSGAIGRIASGGVKQGLTGTGYGLSQGQNPIQALGTGASFVPFGLLHGTKPAEGKLNLKGVNPKAFDMHPEDMQAGKSALDILRYSKKATTEDRQYALKTVQNLLDAYIPGHKYSNTKKALNALENIIQTNEQVPKEFRTPFPGMGLVQGGEFKPPYTRGDLTKLQGGLKDELSTISRPDGNKSRIEMLQYYAKQGDENAQAQLALINDMQSQIDKASQAKNSVAQPPVTDIARIQPQPIESNPLLQQSPVLPSTKPALLDQTPLKPSSGAIIPQGKQRGLVTSVQESPNVLTGTKAKVAGTYIPKPNTQLMGEAQALLQDGAKLDLKHLQNADQKVAATIQEAISKQKTNPELAANLFNNLSQQGTELGRGVQAFSLLNKMSPEAIALSAAGKIKAYNRTAMRPIPELNGEQVKMISDRVAAMSNLKVGSREHNIAVNELQKTINEFIPSTLADKAITVWKAGLLTSLRTHERNLLGNTIMAGAETAKDFIASPIDRLLALKTGKRSLALNLQGTGQGTMQGLQAAKDIIQKGYDPEATIAKFDQKSITWGNNPLEQALKKGTNAVFRTLGGEDKPFLHGATARSLYDQAKVEAMNVGKQGDQKFIQNLVANPTKQMIKTAEIDANYATFHDKNMLSGIANAIKRVAQNPKNGIWSEFGKAVTEIVAPFTGVPSSIAMKTKDYSPIGLGTGLVRAGAVLSGKVPEMQRQAAQEIGRGVIGTGLFGLGAYLMSKGLMTGQPKDTTEANLWAAQGKQANSILIGGQWRSINSIGPQNLMMLAGAKYQQEMGKPGGGDLGAYAGALGKDQLSQTFLAGVQGPLNAITDPARYGQSYIGNQSASIVPNIIKDTSKAFDPNQRENNTVKDYFTNSIPGLRNQNVPKRDVLGNVMKQEPTGPAAFTDLFNSKTPINNTITNELNRLNGTGNDATPSKLNATQTILKKKVKLTPQELNSFEAGSGQAVQQQLGNLIGSADYKSLSDEEKAKAINKTVTDMRAMYKNTNQLQGNTSTTPTITPTASIGKDNKILYVDKGSLKTFDLNPPTSGQGIKAFVNQDWKITKAIEAYDSNLPQNYKDQVFKQMGVSPEDVRYASLAKNNTDVSTQYLLSKSPDHQTLINNIMTGRVVSVAGTQFAANGVIDNLVEQGKLSKAEGTALKKIKLDKNGNNLALGTGARKAKKIAITTSKVSALKTSALKLSKAPKYKMPKTPTFITKKSKPAVLAQYRPSAVKMKFSSKPTLTG